MLTDEEIKLLEEISVLIKKHLKGQDEKDKLSIEELAALMFTGREIVKNGKEDSRYKKDDSR